jgi:hypothetical protein
MPEEAYGKAEMKKMQVYEWHKRFHNRHKTAGFFCMTMHLHFGHWCSKTTLTKSQSQSHVMTEGQSVSVLWCRARDLWPDITSCPRVDV